MSAIAIQDFVEKSTMALEPCVPPVEPEQISWWVARLPLAQVCQADDACRQYAERREWPTLVNDVRAQIFLRLECAKGLAHDERTRDTFGAVAVAEAFLMLTVDFWRDRGASWSEWNYGPQKPPPSFEKN